MTGSAASAGSVDHVGPETRLAARTLADLLRRPAARSGNSPAIVGDGRSASYAELADRSNRLACGLLDLGLSRGDRVAYLGRNATEYWDLFFGTAKAGLVIVPLNFRLAAGEIAWILDDADVSAVVVEQACAAGLPDVRPTSSPR